MTELRAGIGVLRYQIGGVSEALAESLTLGFLLMIALLYV